ncbi:MAG: tRNA (adenosine(37)-N6)-threonylcarbamoyltransferase complex dimerization subunit type 1 TsaB [bacterium]
MILGIDTATRVVALGLAAEGRAIAELALDDAPSRTRTLTVAIGELLGGAGVSRADLSAVGVGEGPGSFTGLRVGIAAAQGLACGLGIPCVGVSTLEAIAHNAPADASVVAVLVDAGRGEVFLGELERRGGSLVRRSDPRALSPGQAAEAIPDGAFVLGDGWLRYRSVLARLLGDRVRVAPDELAPPRGATVAELARRVLAASAESSRRSNVEATYVREPDARPWTASSGA